MPGLHSERIRDRHHRFSLGAHGALRSHFPKKSFVRIVQEKDPGNDPQCAPMIFPPSGRNPSQCSDSPNLDYQNSPTPTHQRLASITPHRNSIRENFNFGDDRLPQIFPKTFSPKTFSGIFPKNLSGKRDESPVRDFPKMPHRTFHQSPASRHHLMQPTLNPSPYQPAPFSPSTSQRNVGFHIGVMHYPLKKKCCG